jgi:hypothetical protein
MKLFKAMNAYYSMVCEKVNKHAQDSALFFSSYVAAKVADPKVHPGKVFLRNKVRPLLPPFFCDSVNHVFVAARSA